MKILPYFAAALIGAAAAQNYTLREVTSDSVNEESQKLISETGNPCVIVVQVWAVEGSSQDAAIFKAACSNSREYQITVMSGRVFVKDWTGQLFSN